MIDQITCWFLLIFGSLYAIIHGLLAVGTKRLFRPNQNGIPHSVSVIVAARNEEKNIAPLLESLTAQNYPAEKFEIIIVNDRSIDSTAAIVETFQKGSANIRLLTIEANTTDMPNKKNALRSGITEAKNDILVFTDADCVAGKGWLNSISDAFTEDIGVVAGYSPYGKENTS
ncbi:MAG: glycosyltransferase, partial [Bacteroidota bacterium]